MEQEEFEQVAQEIYEGLPEAFRRRIENLRVVVEDYPTEELAGRVGARSKYNLLGLYQGLPLNYRTAAYGSFPVVPDTITLFRKNIESVAGREEQLREKIRQVLTHEIGHYFGMTEEEIRAAGY